eukprot:Hpha_TRINITY_DN7041_c0_g1::TRINITY_DN7041_c0_g1_i1::g.22852::m.22852
MATERARELEDNARAEAQRLEEEASKLSKWLQGAEDEYISALERGDKREVARLEQELATITEKRDGCAAVASRKREEICARSQATELMTLVYLSSLSAPLQLADIAVLGQRAATKNRQRGITGVLFFSLNAGQFIQILEGGVEEVEHIYETIRKDDRHTDVTLLRKQRIDARRFPTWPLHTLDLAEMDKAEQPLQTALAVLTQHAVIADTCMQLPTRAALVNGGNPLYLEPKRARVITLMVGLHSAADIAGADCGVDKVAGTLCCYADTCGRCVTAQGGTLLQSSVARVHAHWPYTQLARATEAALDIVSALSELRRRATDGTGVDPLVGAVFPCVVLAAGNVVLLRHNQAGQSFLEASGPVVSDCEALMYTGLNTNSQLVTSALVAASIASSGRLHFQELEGCRIKCLKVTDVADAPSSLPDEIAKLLTDMRGGVPRQEPRPEPLQMSSERSALTVSDKGKLRQRRQRFERELPLEDRPVAAQRDVSNVLLTDTELRLQFDKLDVNKNGFLGKEEFKEFLAEFDEMGLYDMVDRVDEVLADYNLLGDDKLSFDEFSIIMLKIAQN